MRDQTNGQVHDEQQDRNQALLDWYPMVQRIAHKVAATYGLPQGLETADLVSCGVLGLVQAWDRFDADRGVSFEAFAVPRVKGAVIDAIRASDWVPRKARVKARETGEPLMGLVSMDEGTGYDGESTVRKVVDLEAPQPGAELVAAETRRELMWGLNRLPEREHTIVTLHYFEGVQLCKIAEQLGVTESRVSQLHTRGLRMLREALATTSEPITPTAA